MKSFAKSRWKIWIRITPVGYVCTNNNWYYGWNCARSFLFSISLELFAAMSISTESISTVINKTSKFAFIETVPAICSRLDVVRFGHSIKVINYNFIFDFHLSKIKFNQNWYIHMYLFCYEYWIFFRIDEMNPNILSVTFSPISFRNENESDIYYRLSIISKIDQRVVSEKSNSTSGDFK